MAWTSVYVRHENETEAREQGAALGIVFPANGGIPSGNQRYALKAGIGVPLITLPVYANGQTVTPGVPDPEGGYWSLLAINQDWGGHDATIAAIEGLGVRRYPEYPPTGWMEE